MDIFSFVKLMTDAWMPFEKSKPFEPEGGERTQTMEREIPVAAGKKLTVELGTGGTLTIAGWDKESVALKAELKGDDWQTCEVELTETDEGARLETHHAGRLAPHSGYHQFELKVPAKFDLEIKSAGGKVFIRDVEGRIKGETMGGGLEFKHLKGTIAFNTLGGPMHLSDSEVDGKLETMGGNVLVRDVVGNVEAFSLGGSVSYENVRRRDEAAGTKAANKGEAVNISSLGGGITVEHAPAGADVRTMGGDLLIKSAAEFVRAKTMGGKIEIGAVDGWVEAQTMAGDVRVRMTGDPSQGKRDVTITSNQGNVTLLVPAELSMEVSIELAYTINSSQDFQISSDFELQRRATSEWDNSQGTPRKYLYADGSIAGGLHKIRIVTINGNVSLKRG